MQRDAALDITYIFRLGTSISNAGPDLKFVFSNDVTSLKTWSNAIG